MHSKKTTNSVPEPFWLRTTQSFCPVRGTCHTRLARLSQRVFDASFASLESSKRHESRAEEYRSRSRSKRVSSATQVACFLHSVTAFSRLVVVQTSLNSHYSCAATGETRASLAGTRHSQHDDASGPTRRSPLRERACVANDEPAALPPWPRRRSIDEDAGAAPGGSRGGADARRT